LYADAAIYCLVTVREKGPVIARLGSYRGEYFFGRYKSVLRHLNSAVGRGDQPWVMHAYLPEQR